MAVTRVNRRLKLAALAIALVAFVAVALLYWASLREVRWRAAGRSGQFSQAAHASLSRGAYLYQTAARCAACHGSDLGGGPMLQNPLVAALWVPNLTRGNASVSAYTDAEFERAIRRGLRPDGMRLLLMPSWDYAAMTDDDVASVIAYVRSAKRVVRDPPEFHQGILGRLMLVTGALGFDSDRIADAVRPDPSRAAGAYAARIGGCMRCHAGVGDTPRLSGVPFERTGEPASTLRRLDRATFAAGLNGAGAGGRAPSHRFPAPRGGFSDADVTALYRYVQSLP